MTTDEFLADLTTRNLLADKYQHFLRDFLNLSDLVKFAQLTPSNEETNHALTIITELIEATKNGNGNDEL
jgi:thiaminase